MEIQWTLVLFTAISGTGGWLFASSILDELFRKDAEPGKLEAIVSLVLLVVGGIMSVMHLKHVDRIFEALNRPASGIFIEAALIGTLCVIIAIYFAMIVRKSSTKARLVVGVIGALLAVVFSFECGASYMMDARPAWTNIGLPFAYLGTAAAAGTALNLLLKAAQKREAEGIKFAAMLTLIGGALGVATTAVFCLMSGVEVMSAESGLNLWTIGLFVLLAIACISSAFAIKNANQGALLGGIACIAGFLAAVCLRVVMWLVGSPILDLFLMRLE